MGIQRNYWKLKGNFQEVKNNETVIEAYLGKGISQN